jgi:lactate dehydrogenase-like 2-hydroxyacid dehydrogenase
VSEPNQAGPERAFTLPEVFVGRPIPEAGLALLRAAAQLRIWPGLLPPAPDELRKSVRGCAGILSLLTDRIDAAAMDAAGPGLRVISNFAVGVDNVDVAEASRRGIPVGNTPDVLTETTADLAWALLMAAARRVGEGDRYVREGRWQTWEPQLLLGRDVHGATLGIVGYGRIGRAVARRAQGFGMQVLVTGHGPIADVNGATAVSFDALLEQSDFISIHTPLTVETRGMFGGAAFARMKPSAILVNTARGPIVDPDALAEALSIGRLAGAALDVTDPEPIPLDSPLLKIPTCLVVPHIGSASVQTRDRMATMAASNLLAGLRGEPLPHCVNREALAG